MILVMWSLLVPLEVLEDFLTASLPQQCAIVHEAWQIKEPEEGCEVAYDVDAWKDKPWLQFKAIQNAHSSNREVTMWFVARTSPQDDGLKGDQLVKEDMFEALSLGCGGSTFS